MRRVSQWPKIGTPRRRTRTFISWIGVIHPIEWTRRPGPSPLSRFRTPAFEGMVPHCIPRSNGVDSGERSRYHEQGSCVLLQIVNIATFSANRYNRSLKTKLPSRSVSPITHHTSVPAHQSRSAITYIKTLSTLYSRISLLQNELVRPQQTFYCSGTRRAKGRPCSACDMVPLARHVRAGEASHLLQAVDARLP